MSGSAARTIAIRLTADNAEPTRRALEQVGESGERALRRIDAPIAPVMIGLILGPVGDQQLRRALAISDGDWSVFLTRPLSLALVAIAVALAFWRPRSSS